MADDPDNDGAPSGGTQQHVPDFANRSKIMLGEDQWQWLKDQLRIPCDFCLLISPIQLLAVGHGFECFYMLPFERERMLHLLQTTNNTLVLSGDQHTSAVYNAEGIVEVTSSSLTHSVPEGLLEHEIDETWVTEFVYENNFGMLDLDWEDGKIDISIRRCSSGTVLGRWKVSLDNVGSLKRIES
jgi:alkaline phosphatase D